MADSTSSPPAAKRPKTTTTEQTSLTNFFQVTKKSQSMSSAATRNDENTRGRNDVDASTVVVGAAVVTTTTTATANAKKDDDDDDDDKQQEKSSQYEAIIPTPVSCVDKNVSWKTYRGACIYRQLSTEPPRTRVAAFDLDGTLLEWRTSGWPSRMEHYELWNGGVIDKMRHLHDNDGCKLVIFSNQGAIRGALQGKKATHVKALVDWLANTIDRPLHVLMSTNKKDEVNNFHKPSSNMWRVAQDVCNRGQEFDVSHSFYVGDSVGGEDDNQGGVDIQFAKNVGVKFYTPEEYFGPSNKQLRERMQSMGDEEEPPKETLEARAALTGGYLQGPILLILCGVQGSGKSTFCEHLIDGNAQWVHLSQDTINGGKKGTREKVEVAARQALINDKSVVIDRMHLDETQRAYFVGIAKEVGVPAHAVALYPDKNVVLQRVRDRENHPGGVEGEKGVKIATKSKLEMPKYAEGFTLISASATVEGAARIVDCYRSVSVTEGKKVPIPISFQLSSDVALPSIALGTYKLGRKVTKDVVIKALGMGFEAIDTAPTYKNEDKIGEALDEAAFVLIKVPKRAISKEKVVEEMEKTLSNLSRSHGDLLLLHWPSDVIAAERLKEVWQAMENLQKEGRVRAIGVCNFNVSALRILLPNCTIPPAVNQVERHPLLPQLELVDFCARHDIVLQAHTPLGQGSPELLEHTVVKQVVESTGQSAAQIVLAWNLQQGVAVAVKCISDEHMKEALSVQSSSGHLSADHIKALNELHDKKRFVDPPFMYGSAPYCWGKQCPSN